MSVDHKLNVPAKPANGELTSAVESNDVQAVKDLLERGADVEDADESGNTALMFAVKNDPEIICLLVDRGADPYKKNNDGNTALDWLDEEFDMSFDRLPLCMEIKKILKEAPQRCQRFLEEKFIEE